LSTALTTTVAKHSMLHKSTQAKILASRPQISWLFAIIILVREREHLLDAMVAK